MNEQEVMHTILWRRLDLPGHEICSLALFEAGWELSGTAIFTRERHPCKLAYRVVCDRDWHTVSAEVRGRVGERNVALSISTDEAKRWRLNGTECPAVAGCLDIDLGFSPATNLLPIRRLALDVGEGAEVRAAWLPFPSLSFESLLQIYRREGITSYRYESAGGRFVRTLEVNAAGFVTNYPGLWQAESAI